MHNGKEVTVLCGIELTIYQTNEREFPATFLQRKTEFEKKGVWSVIFSRLVLTGKRGIPQKEVQISGWNFRKMALPFTLHPEFSEILVKR